MLPPGPDRSTLVQMLHMTFRPAALLEECARRFGDAFTLRFPGQAPHVFFCHPDAVREIFAADPEDLRAGESNADLGPMLGTQSLLLLDGARHLRERRLMLPPFHGERMQAYGTLMRDITDRAVDAWPLGRPFPIHRETQAITLEVILRAVFGLDEGPRLAELRARLRRLMAFAAGPAVVLLFIPWLQVDLGPLSPGGRFARLKGAVDELLLAEIARRRAAGTAGRDDILSMLLEARYEDGAPMSAESVRDQMMTLLLAGHETTATSLAWVFHQVLDRPDVLAKLGAELAAVVGDGDVEPRHLARLEYLDAVIKETARLNPVLAWVGRRVARPLRIGGWDLPAGVEVEPCIYLVHRRPDLWPDPERFLPERFLGARPNPSTFFPFGGGVRRCLGAAFATYEMKVVLARLLARVEMRAAPGSHVRLVRRNITFAPSGGMPVVVDARMDRPAAQPEAASALAG